MNGTKDDIIHGDIDNANDGQDNISGGDGKC